MRYGTEPRTQSPSTFNHGTGSGALSLPTTGAVSTSATRVWDRVWRACAGAPGKSVVLSTSRARPGWGRALCWRLLYANAWRKIGRRANMRTRAVMPESVLRIAAVEDDPRFRTNLAALLQT